jgi:mRNA interferase MazF
VIIAPMTTKSKSYPSRVELSFQGKKGYIVLDQIRTVDKSRFIKKLGSPEKKTIIKIKKVIQEMLVD